MLNAVPVAVNRAARTVVLRHPNSMDCAVWRKRLLRVEADPESGEPSEMGGAATLGGMGVLRSEDEADFDYVEQGPGKCLFGGVFTPASMNDREDAPAPAQMREGQVQPTKEPGEEGYFELDVGDLVLVLPGMGTVLAYEVVEFIGSVDIAPYVRKAVLNPRDDLHSLEPFLPGE